MTIQKLWKMRKSESQKYIILPGALALAACLALSQPFLISAKGQAGKKSAGSAQEEAPAQEEDGSAVSAQEDPEEVSENEETPDPHSAAYYLPVESNGISQWPQGPQVEAESAVVMDLDYGVILYEKNMDQKLYPASITKIMTALLVIENADLSDVVTFSENAVYGIEPDSSHIGIDVGEQLTVEQSLYALILASANEVAMGLAEHVGGSVEGFADMMNKRAAELGCENTHFSNPHGLHDENHYTTAHDMALIARAAYKNRTFRGISATIAYEIPPTNMEEESRYLVNHHKLLSDDDWYYRGCRGGKTGFTDQAMNTLVTYAKRDNCSLVCVDMKTDGLQPIYSDTCSLLDYGFANFRWQQAQPVADVEVDPPLCSQQGIFKNEENTCWLEARSPGWVLLPQGISMEKLTSKTTTEANVAGPWRIKTSYYYEGQYLGYSYQYENPLLKN